MTSFIQRLVSRISGSRGPRSPRVFLGAFGKHPGWNDHIDDIGLETDELVSIKRLLYVQGIAGNIDSGAWDALADDQQLARFRHVLLWRRDEDVIVGRLWSSRDGKGRSKYPMIVCAQCTALPLSWALQTILPRLETLQEQCQQATDAPGVVALLDCHRSELRQLVAAQAPAESILPPDQGVLPALAARPEMGPDARGLMIVLYAIERELAAFRADADRAASTGPRHLRVPACGSDSQQVLTLWLHFLAAQLAASAPVYLLLPLDGDWVDILVGEPSPAQLFCLRAGPRKIPLTTEIPYTLDAEFIDRCTRLIQP